MTNVPKICYINGPHDPKFGLPKYLICYSPFSNTIESSLSMSIDDLLRYNKEFPESNEVKSPELLLANSNVSIHSPVDNMYTQLFFTNKYCGNLNSFGYFIYSTYNPPLKVSDIDVLYILFSKVGEIKDKNLYEENIKRGAFVYIPSKVELTETDTPNTFNGKARHFDHSAGTSIGFFIISNGWNPNNSKVHIEPDYSNVFFSLAHLNPEINIFKKPHFIFNTTVRFFGNGSVNIGCEDVNNENPEKDMDFNDLLFSFNRMIRPN